jgi:hypothetical protein
MYARAYERFEEEQSKSIINRIFLQTADMRQVLYVGCYMC